MKKLEIVGNIIGVLIIILFGIGFIFLIMFTNSLISLIGEK